ncbi:hypothetical protein GCM10011332_10150 [Terasakiella brassicae]|uniref:Uncharacterized protein n=1 Tax=Terasakiella brassicae TaxID=1634917 RepID=A0A917F7U1_9PROT|nr:hypothetical protein [Terasakiella brassicae]GGF58562.1 hypothetical protein GCM10011332_10150 [Terasakiella brassicae]
MFYTNKIIRDNFASQNKEDYPLSTELKELLSNGLIEVDNGLFFKSFQNSLKTITNENSPDITGRECTINKFHIEDYVNKNVYQQAFLTIKYIWEMCKDYNCRIILGDDEGDLNIRFHQIRYAEKWLDENLEKYKLNGILYLDTNECMSFPKNFADFLDKIAKPCSSVE